MPIIHAIILGLTQGLAEFLPISSSGHLKLVPWLFGWNDFDGNDSLSRSFDVALHIGTLSAVIAYFGKELIVYIRDGMALVFARQRPTTEEGRLAWLLVLSMVPAAAVGAVADSFIEDHLSKIWLIAVNLIVFGLLLGVADRRRGHRQLNDYSARDALLIGTGQMLALVPGVSRSGATMTTGRFLGLTRDAAARASFLMAIPVTVGAIVFKLGKQLSEGVPSDIWPPLIVGVITSAISGYAAVWGTLKLIRTRSFDPFVVYRVAAGAAVLIALSTTWR
ncbi:MAG: undecaprenyl-diphosphate phosphatase [Acidimicrobiia bacterium]